jgi:FkbM family methyltransferase
MNSIKSFVTNRIPDKIFDLAEKIVRISNTNKRKKILNDTIGKDLEDCHIDSLELLQLIKNEISNPIIFDIGAYIGTWTQLAVSILPNAKLYLFEPIAINFQKLKENLGKLNNCELFNLGIGANEYKTYINVANCSDASSILNLEDNTTKTYNIQNQRKEEIEIFSLDHIIAANNLPKPNVIKLDIQGYELEAFKGAIDTLKNVEFIICEVSFIPFYKNQPLFSDIITFLKEHDLEVNAFSTTTALGKQLEQTDVLFKKISK